ncbi:Outer membrane protein assembly factor BamB [Stieleria varia]|uniref:Outer membrane protein assembly factor BamB n=2 Tax=Stieleria varia TaxID=2528005 RepID=A0A5C6B259_9BACT|nr:Outer membrane protein assembly factor BamB [Stieleria varia]
MYCALIALSAILGADHVSAQNMIIQNGQPASGRFIEPPRWLLQQVREAESAIEKEQYSEAVVRLGDLLQGEDVNADGEAFAGQDYFLSIDPLVSVQRLDESVLKKCRDMIGNLPEAARETYELRYGPLAQRELDEAAQSRDWQRLRDVRRKFFHTAAGYTASYLLAVREMQTGHPLAASALLDDVVSQQRAIKQIGQGVRVLHSAACSVSGRDVPDPPVANNATVVLGGSETTLPSSDQWPAWLDEHFSVTIDRAGGEMAEYRFLGGGSNRNETRAGEMPIGNASWVVPTVNSTAEERMIMEESERLVSSGKLPPPSWSPLRIGDHVLMRCTERLRGIDHRTGKRIWEWPWYSADNNVEDDETVVDLAGPDENPTDVLVQRVWNDLPYGQVTSDGERVFMLDSLESVQPVMFNAVIGIQGTLPKSKEGNTLVALELATEGKLLWRLGQGESEGTPLSEAFFLGAPLPVDGRLYAMVEISGDISLVCLDPASGELLWLQQLVSMESLGVEYDAVRRISGATPTYHEGVLICPTGAGVTIAIDLGDRMLRWGRSYPRKATVPRGYNTQQSAPDAEALMQRWHHGSAIASGRYVVQSPSETDQMFCWDVLSGKTSFNTKQRESALYVAGIQDDQCLIVGPNEVQAIDLATGSTKWTTKSDLLPSGEQIVGRGVFGIDSYLLPVSGNQLFQISLEDGSLLQHRSVNFSVGNLVAVDGEILSQSPTQLSLVSGEKSLAQWVEQAIAATPDDVNVLVQQAQLYVQRDERTKALEVLDKARELEPDNDDALALSVSAMLGMYRADPDQSDDFIDELSALIHDSSQRMEFLALRIQKSLRDEMPIDAIRQLTEFSSEVIDQPTSALEAGHSLTETTRQAAPSSWISARAAEVRSVAQRTEKLTDVNQIVSDYLENKSVGSNSLLRRLLRFYQPLGVGELSRRYAKNLLQQDETLAAERAAMGIAVPPNTPVKQTDTENQTETSDAIDSEYALMLAEVYARGRFGADALNWLAAAGPIDEQSERVAEIEKLAKGSQPETASALDVKSQVQLNWSSERLGNPGYNRMNVRSVAQPSLSGCLTFEGWNVISDQTSVWTQDPLGEPRRLSIQRIPTGNDDAYEVAIHGGIMLMIRPGEITAVDLFNLREQPSSAVVLWRRNLGNSDAAMSRRRSAISKFGSQHTRYSMSSRGQEFRVGPILGDRVVVLQGGELMAIDILTNETLWRNSEAPISGSIVTDGHEVAVVRHVGVRSGVLENEIALFDVLDGKKNTTRPWQHGEVWETNGRNVLAYSPGEDPTLYDVKLVDAFTDEVLLSMQSPVKQQSKLSAPKGYGEIVGNRYMVLLDTLGQLTVWDIQEGKEICRQEVTADDRLISIHCLLSEGRLLVMPERYEAPSDLVTRSNNEHLTVHGVYAISLESGDLQWERTFDEPWGCTLSQPYRSPVVFFTRSITTHEPNKRTRTVRLDVQMLDISDGKTLHEELAKEVASNSNGLATQVRVSPWQNQVVARIESETLVYTFAAFANGNQTENDTAEKESNEPGLSGRPLEDE